MKRARFYRIRLVKGAAWSAIKVWFGPPLDPDTGDILWERPCLWRCLINGQDDAIEAVMIELDGTTGLPVIKGDEISETDYLYHLKTYIWARDHAPDSPEAKPKQKIDPLTAPLPF